MSDTHVLGPLCKRGHDHEGTGQSLRYKSTRQCVACMVERRETYERAYYQANAERLRQRAQEYYRANRRRYLEQMAAYRKTPAFAESVRKWRENVDPAHLRAIQKKSRERHSARRKENWRDWADRNAEYLRERYRAWAHSERGREVRRALNNKHRARKKAAIHIPYGAHDVFLLFDRFEQRCAYCGADATTIDHVVALPSGPDALCNLVPCCRPCNSSKKGQDVYAWFCQRPTFTEERWLAILGQCSTTARNRHTPTNQ